VAPPLLAGVTIIRVRTSARVWVPWFPGAAPTQIDHSAPASGPHSDQSVKVASVGPPEGLGLGLLLALGDTDALVLGLADPEDDALGLDDALPEGLTLALGETEAEGETEADSLEPVDGEGDGDTLDDAEEDGEALRLAEADGLTLRLGLGDTEGLGLELGLGEAEGDEIWATEKTWTRGTLPSASATT
jgi:hypothetical protein